MQLLHHNPKTEGWETMTLLRNKIQGQTQTKPVLQDKLNKNQMKQLTVPLHHRVKVKVKITGIVLQMQAKVV